jgi:guanosine-3',5'-bis(diphosphate) 3'-pyrophosphohydrolase
MDEFQESYKKALAFAAEKHQGQLLPGTSLPYLVHVTNVAMEVTVAGMNSSHFNLPFAASVGLLHDTLEDTSTSYNELEKQFGKEIAEAVLALTKFPTLPKEEQIKDSVRRIKTLPKEVWAVKLADRITNLQAPPLEWDFKKRKRYMCDAEMIHTELKEGNQFLAERLASKLIEYQQFVYIGDK